MTGEVGFTIVCCRPIGLQSQDLSSKFAGDAEAFRRAQPGDARAPVIVLAVAGGAPITLDELTNGAGDHQVILPPGSEAAGARQQAWHPLGMPGLPSCLPVEARHELNQS